MEGHDEDGTSYYAHNYGVFLSNGQEDWKPLQIGDSLLVRFPWHDDETVRGVLGSDSSVKDMKEIVLEGEWRCGKLSVAALQALNVASFNQGGRLLAAESTRQPNYVANGCTNILAYHTAPLA